MEATVNSILREWRELWPGGLTKRQYSTLNLMAYCRHGLLGHNRARCGDCRHLESYPSSCGDRHCPKCLGPRQARWSAQVCSRLPDCAHFHVVFTLPAQLNEWFKLNYRIAATLLFAAAAETIKLFQASNWRMNGAFLAVLHTWGSALNWHPHLHVLVSAGGWYRVNGRWRQVRPDYMFPVGSMSRVFGPIFLRKLEELDSDPDVRWPEELDTMEKRRSWRVNLAARNWNIFTRATLGNTRAVVRYLARYTSRIAISNQRITAVDPSARTVSFNCKNYRNGGRIKEVTIPGGTFLRCFTQHLVPKGFRRVRYFGLLTGRKDRIQQIPDAPQRSIGEEAPIQPRPACPRCGGQNWTYPLLRSFPHLDRPRTTAPMRVTRHCRPTPWRFSLQQNRASPNSQKHVQQEDEADAVDLPDAFFGPRRRRLS
jgi:hypothetical protein